MPDDYAVEEALHELEHAVKAPDRAPDPSWRRTVPIPEDFPEYQEGRGLFLSPEEDAALDALHEAMSGDLRFEHLDEKAVAVATGRFVCLTHYEPDHCHVPWFMGEYAHDLMERVCAFPVTLLSVDATFDLREARLIPAEDARPPEPFRSPFPNAPMGCVIEVPCIGTDHTKMGLRAKTVAEHALRGLRAGLREDSWLPDKQVRFELGENVWFDDGASGWTHGAATGWDYAASTDALQKATSYAIANLPAEGGNEIEQSARRALVWWEDGQMAVDPLHRLLFLFFSLEAMLGTKSGEKGRPLALRRAVLSTKRLGHFAHPGRVYWLYKDFRNAAVHGGEVPPLSDEERETFEWDARLAMNDYLEFAASEGVESRDDLLALLDADPDMPTIEERFLPPAR